MHIKTINDYNKKADQYSELYNTLIPIIPRQMALKYFHKNKSTIDIGCGQGRDVKWLNENDYPCIGYDAAYNMLINAEIYNPEYNYELLFLPDVSKLKNIYNIFCCGVLSHLHLEHISLSVSNMLQILVPDGIIVLSYRCTDQLNCREGERLYTLINEYEFETLFEVFGAKLLHKESNLEYERNLLWYNFTFQKRNDKYNKNVT